MAFPNTGGYDQEFLDPPAKLKKFECLLCLLVTREPNLTSCCGQHFCQSCINRIITDRKPCPCCKELSFTTFLDKKRQRKILQLKVNCLMKLRGCSWTGELRELDSHTDTGAGDCRFVDMTCPNNCGKSPQRRHMKDHLSRWCLKRPFTCKYCTLRSTYEVVCKHHDQCTKFPLPCPNKCEVESVERGKMKEHLSECPHQLVDCEFAHAGCSEKIKRNNLKKHMKDNVQQHLLCVFTASQKQTKEFQKQMVEVRRERDQQLKEVRRERDQQLKGVRRERDQQLKEVRRERDKQLKEKDRMIELLQNRVTALEKYAGGLPLVEFTVSYYSQKENALQFEGPTFHTHPRGVKVQVGTNYHWSGCFYVELFQLPGEFDDEIEWPVKCTVTVHLLNQLGDHDHIHGSKTLTLNRQQEKTYIQPDPLGIQYSDIEDCSKVGIRYLKDDCLKVKVYVELK